MQRTCVVCGGPFDAKRVTARYCGERCKKRAQRGAPLLSVVPAIPSGRLAARTSSTSSRGDQPEAPAGHGDHDDGAADGLPPRTLKVIEELTQADRLDTALGAAAVGVARIMDAGPHSAAGYAALNRELRATLAEALKGTANEDNSPLAEMRRRRLQRLSGA